MRRMMMGRSVSTGNLGNFDGPVWEKKNRNGSPRRPRRFVKHLLFALLTLYLGFKSIDFLWFRQDSSVQQAEINVGPVQQTQPSVADSEVQQTQPDDSSAMPPAQVPVPESQQLLLNPVESPPVIHNHPDGTMTTTLTLLRNLKSNHRVIPLVSRLDYWGLPTTIEFPDLRTFNPTMIALPYPGEDRNATYVVLVRDEYKYGQNAQGFTYQIRTIFGGLLQLKISDEESKWRLRDPPKAQTHSVLLLDGLVNSPDTYFPNCEPESPDGLGSIQGPEDARLFWSHLGEPLVIYTSINPPHSELCRHFYLVDLRAIYPAAAEVIDATLNPPPIRFGQSVPITYSGHSGFHKNWAPFTTANGDVYIQTQIIPQTIFKLKTTDPNLLPNFNSEPADLISLEPVLRHPPDDENCLTIAFRGFRRRRLHQSTPFLDVVLCRSEDVRSGACDPEDPKNRLYMGLIHAQYHETPLPTIYEPRIVTLNSTYPFNYVSISKPLVFLTIPISDTTYTVSISFRKPGATFASRDLSRGYLDDRLVLSFGWWDTHSHFLELDVEEVLKGHYICEDLIYEYITGM